MKSMSPVQSIYRNYGLTHWLIIKTSICTMIFHEIAWILNNIIIQIFLTGHIDHMSVLVQVMACCLMATSHYLNQNWLRLPILSLGNNELIFQPLLDDWFPNCAQYVPASNQPKHCLAHCTTGKSAWSEWEPGCCAYKIWRAMSDWPVNFKMLGADDVIE